MSILGRDRELARLETQLESLPTGPVRLLIEGEAGIGKTTVLLGGIAAAEGRGYRVLETRPAEADGALPWSGLGDLFADVPDDAFADLPQPQCDALEVALLRRAVGARPPDPRAVFTAFLNVVTSLARDRPTVVAVDDLQWLDPPSARAFEFLGRRATNHSGLALLATTRVVDDVVFAPTAAWFTMEERLRLAPLSIAALHHLLQERLGVHLPRPAVIRLHRVCAGNAFHALEIAQRLPRAGLADAHADWPLPTDVRELVRTHVRTLDEDARLELVLAAASAQPTEALLAPATVAAAERAGLIAHEHGQLTFAHPLYAEAVYASASEPERRHAHRRLAESEPDHVERAWHLGLSASSRDEQIAAELETAADHARLRGAPETAAQLLERAIELTPTRDRDAAGRRRLAAAADWFGAGAIARSRELLTELLDETADRRLRARALRLLALVHSREESVPQALERLHESAAAAGPDDDLRAPAELELAFMSVNVSLEFEAARPHADRALACAERLGDPGVLAQALAVKAIADFLLGDGLDEALVERALELEPACSADVPVELRPSLIGGSLALYAGKPRRALQLLEALEAQMRAQGIEADLPLLLCVIEWARAWAGDLVGARAAGTEALELAELAGSDSHIGYVHANAAMAAAHAGDEPACRAHVAEALAGMERTGYLVHATWSLSALAMLELSRADPTAAAAALRPLLDVFEEAPPSEPIRAFFLPDAVEALAGCGELARATRLNELFAERARVIGRTWAVAASHRSRALIAAAEGDLDAARQAAEAAIELQAQGELPLELARSLLVLGQVERRAKQKAAAKAALAESAAICERIGAALWAVRARDDLARLGGRPKTNELTPTEQRMAQLAASGLTNREIAGAAFVSEKTVESNLSRVYRKLGVRSRTELAHRLADYTEQPTPIT